VRCDCSLCWYWWDVIVRYVDIGEMWLFVMSILVRCDCSLCWYWWDVIVRYVDIGEIVDHQCFNLV